MIVQFSDVFLDANATKCVLRIGQKCVERGWNKVDVEKLEDEAVLADIELKNGNKMVLTTSEARTPLGVETEKKFAIITRAVNIANIRYSLTDLSSFLGDSDFNDVAMKIDRI
ncbi:hypothetical protein Salat_2685300 [Sesamum alatum]|uniref:Uncharacterized protein n=1 Tax=Sesamum alatum TaxID=300844 RepID=A0AAE1XPQ4_9LAMI|nr:hypothetical protein Salat_2685300 [Sesamum alatum]